MTTYELVRTFFKDATDEECDFFLWETTCYPMGSYSIWLRQLRSNKRAVLENKSVCECCGGHYKRDGKQSFHDICLRCDKRVYSNNNQIKTRQGSYVTL